jgi:uncharacterized protein (DUF849 family)
MANPFIVMCAPNGARKTKHDHPGLPITADELADCAESILAAGASVMHVHVRDERQAHSLDVERYRAATAAIRERVGDEMIIQVTTEACGIYRAGQQMSMVRELGPEAVSLALAELCPDEESEARAADFYSWLQAEHIMVQHILYSLDELRRFAELRNKGVIPDRRPFVLVVLGKYASDLTGDPHELGAFADAIARDITWAVCCFGSTEREAAATAAASGGHARVGFENNLLLTDGSVAPDNAALVSQAVIAVKESGRPIATAGQVREMLGYQR